HNRGSSVAHYFEGIHLLDVGDEIIYITNMGERRYQVFSQKEISNTDWSVTLNTEENIITLITCVTGQPEKRLCVQAKEV
ncbi:MAG: sortase, partial [Clostridia bacterium]|nr:sortase [Clostridia bacterium]